MGEPDNLLIMAKNPNLDMLEQMKAGYSAIEIFSANKQYYKLLEIAKNTEFPYTVRETAGYSAIEILNTYKYYGMMFGMSTEEFPMGVRIGVLIVLSKEALSPELMGAVKEKLEEWDKEALSPELMGTVKKRLEEMSLDGIKLDPVIKRPKGKTKDSTQQKRFIKS